VARAYSLPEDLPPSAWVLVFSNLLPLAGVLYLGWDLGLVLLLYWAESAVILAFSLAKLAMRAGLAAIALVPFFLVHAGGFMGVHLMFLLFLFVDVDGGVPSVARELAWPLAVLALSHGFSFWANDRRKGEAYGKPQDVMGAFYARVVVMHLAIVFGGWIVALLGQPAGALVILVVLKTGIDLAAHLRERRRHAPADGEAPAPSAS
jgi:hypothetical protein